MYTLGLSSYSHEASCALLKDGAIVALGEEERYNREKHTARFPANAIRDCLQQAGIGARDVDAFAFFWRPLLEVTGNFKHMLRYFPGSLNLLRAGQGGGGEGGHLQRLWRASRVGHELRAALALPRTPRVHFIEHHLAHAASAFFVSPFEEAAVLTLDGRGECASTLLARGQGARLEKVLEVRVPHSLGHLYAAVTDFLGFTPFHDEWKVMGLSAYGQTTYAARFAELLHLHEAGFSLDLRFFSFHHHGARQWLSPRFSELFGAPFARGAGTDQRAADIAFALQRTVEAAGVHLAKQLRARVPSRNLCLTGGVALNCLMNRQIFEDSGFENFFIQPIANDAGTSLGAALYHYHQELGRERRFVFEHPYWGSSFGNEEIETALRARGVRYRLATSLAEDTAAHIAEGKIVGWFQGRMESGPRALGNRSILADPTRPDMKDRLNARVKRREGFRPFAPSVLEERVHEFFEMPRGQLSPYMILVGLVRESQRARLPAITHADQTARVHTVSRSTNPRYYSLIEAFGKRTGVPVLLNTSFNENEPIVRTPAEAIDCFLRTDFDVLAIGDFLVEKHG